MIKDLVMERIAPYGSLQQLSTTDLIKVLVGENGIAKVEHMINDYEIFDDGAMSSDILKVAALPFSELISRGNLTQLEAARICCGVELGLRIGAASTFNGKYFVKLSQPCDVYEYLKPRRLRFADHEEFIIILLNTKNYVVGAKAITTGTLNGSLVDPKQIYSYVLMHPNTSAIIAVHNHPSFNPLPSPEDLRISKSLVDSGKLLNIPLLDHIIIGGADYYSLRDHNQL